MGVNNRIFEQMRLHAKIPISFPYWLFFSLFICFGQWVDGADETALNEAAKKCLESIRNDLVQLKGKYAAFSTAENIQITNRYGWAKFEHRYNVQEKDYTDSELAEMAKQGGIPASPSYIEYGEGGIILKAVFYTKPIKMGYTKSYKLDEVYTNLIFDVEISPRKLGKTEMGSEILSICDKRIEEFKTNAKNP